MVNDQQQKQIARFVFVAVVVPTTTSLVRAVMWKANHLDVQARGGKREIFTSVGIVGLLCNTVGISRLRVFAICCTGHDIEMGNNWHHLDERRMGHRPSVPHAQCEP
jgi:hypothetical protein